MLELGAEIPTRKYGTVRDPEGALWVIPETSGRAFRARQLDVRPWKITTADVIYAYSYALNAIAPFRVLNVEKAWSYFGGERKWIVWFAVSYERASNTPRVESIAAYRGERLTVFRPAK